MKHFSQSKSQDSLGCSRHRDSEAWVKKRGTMEITLVVQLKTAVLIPKGKNEHTLEYWVPFHCEVSQMHMRCCLH